MNVVSLLTATLVLATASSAFGQTPSASPPTPLSQLVAEAEANNPQVSAADHGARAAKQVAPQMTTLPDPKFTYQQLSVGSPKPFAGYTNSDFAYIGVGASQELPYPGKLRLRGEVTERDADTKQAEVEVTRTSLADSVKPTISNWRICNRRLSSCGKTSLFLTSSFGMPRPIIRSARRCNRMSFRHK
jgi:cobalt-zinc-cadmium efflux system outer membrane protein